MRVLAIDIGTSSVRATVYNGRLQAVRPGAHVRCTWTSREDGSVEATFARLEQLIASAIDTALAGESRAIDAVGIAAFWHSLVGVDAAARAITPVLPWSDTRAADQASALRGELDEHAVHARTGCRVHPTYWPARLRWFREHDRRLFQQVRRWMSFPAYLERRWLDRDGESVSQASGTGFFVHDGWAWDAELCAACEVDPRQFGNVHDVDFDEGTLSPRLARRWPALRHARWVPAAGDGALNNVGAGCTDAGRATVMIGTSGALRTIWRTTRAPAVPFELWRYWLDARHVVVGGALSNGGNLVAWMADRCGLTLGPRLEAALSRLPPDGHGLTMLPYFAGERSPEYFPDVRATISGLGISTSAIEILRAGLEAIAYRLRAVMEPLSRTQPLTRLVAAGTALTSSPTWMQIVADVLNLPVQAPREAELTSRGAAIVALRRCDAARTVPRPAIARVFRPNPRRHEIYMKAADRQRRLQERLLR